MKINKSEFVKVFENPTLDHTSKELVQQVLDFIWNFDKAVVQDFYIGVTNIPEKRLFEGHKLQRNSRRYLLLEATNEDAAVKAEKALLTLDITGGIDDNSGKYLYCYYIDGCTKESRYTA